MLISLKKKFVLGPCGRICFFVEHVTHEELYSWVCGIWSISKRWLVVIQVLKSLILTAKLLKSSFFFFFYLFREAYYYMLKYVPNLPQIIYLLVNIFTIAIFSSIVIYEQHIFLEEIYWQEFSHWMLRTLISTLSLCIEQKSITSWSNVLGIQYWSKSYKILIYQNIQSWRFSVFPE